MSDEELLNRYKNYKKKRNIIIFIIFLLLVLSLIIVSNFPKDSIDDSKPLETKQEEPKKDEIRPVLELEKYSDELEENSEIEYEKYIKSAIDDIDGDITDKVQFNRIDTSKIGIFDIVYYVFDSSNNMSQKTLQITIVKKEEPVVDETPVIKETPTSKPQQPSNENKPKVETKPTIKYFMFTDGYNMGNVVEVCAEELKKSNRTGRCLPITDDNGIYLGMKLELN